MLLSWAEKFGVKTGWTVAKTGCTVAMGVSTLPLLAFALSVDMSDVYFEAAKRCRKVSSLTFRI